MVWIFTWNMCTNFSTEPSKDKKKCVAGIERILRGYNKVVGMRSVSRIIAHYGLTPSLPSDSGQRLYAISKLGRLQWMNRVFSIYRRPLQLVGHNKANNYLTNSTTQSVTLFNC